MASRLRVWLVGVVLALLLALAAVPQQAQAHAPWTCKHRTALHLTWGGSHESRFQYGFRRGGNHYHVYAYYKWVSGFGWVFVERDTRLCNGTH